MENNIENAKTYLLGRIDYESDMNDVAALLVAYAEEVKKNNIWNGL